jgi:hypothetical protein
MTGQRVEAAERFGGGGAGFPLTPTLSPRERENGSQRVENSGRHGLSASHTTALPLPKGEDRGEGRGGGRRRSGPPHARTSACLVAKLFLPLLLTASVEGCVTKSKARAQAREAFVAGQQEALARMLQAQSQAQGPTVMVNGQVRNRVVPWTEGLTLTKALVAADYYGATNPGQIIIVRNGIGRRYDPKLVLSGADVPLEAGDTVQLLPQPPASKK